MHTSMYDPGIVVKTGIGMRRRWRMISLYGIIMYVNSTQTRTLARIFEEPVRPDMRWSDVCSLLTALGAAIAEGRGSRVRITLNKQHLMLHRPHPQPELKPYMVRSVREFLRNAGVSPK